MLNVWRAVQTIKLHSAKISLFSYYLDPLRRKYVPQHPIIEHPQPTSFFGNIALAQKTVVVLRSTATCSAIQPITEQSVQR